MMRYMRSGFLSGFFVVFLVLGGFSLVLTDWTGSFRSGVTSHDVAKIGSEKVTMVEFQNLVARTLRAQNIPVQQAYQLGMINQILTSEIWTRMLDRAANEYGIMVGDDLLTKHLQDLATPIAKTEHVSVASVVKRFIESQEMSETAFMTSLRRELNTNTLRTVLTGPAEYVSPLMQRDLAAYQQQTRNGQYVILPDDKVKGVTTPTDKELEEFYEREKNNYMMAERRSFRIGTLPRAALEKQVKLDATAARKFYDSHQNELQRAEQRTLSQAVYAAPAEDDAKKLADELKGNADFLTIAKTIGKPSSVTSQDYGRDGFLPELADPVFNAKVGDIVGPIKTALGWHVIRVDKIIPAGTPSFEDVKDAIEKQLRDDALGDLLDARLDALDQAHENGSTLDDVAKDNGLTIVPFTNLSRDGKNDKGVDDTAQMAAAKGPILTAAFTGTDTNRVSAPIELPDGNIAVIEVTTITPAKPRPLADIRADLTERWMTEKRKQKNLMDAQTLLPDLVAGKLELEKVAADHGVPLNTLTAATRTQAEIPATMDRANWLRLFDAEIDKPVFQPVKGGLLMAVMTSATLPDRPAINPETLKTVTEEAAKGQGNETLVQYVGTLMDRYSTRINDRLLKQMYAPKDSTAE